MRLSGLLLVLSLSACGGNGGTPTVGGTCSTADDCDDGLTCNTNVVGGLCTRTCTASGEQAECPEGAVCDTLDTEVLCLKRCDDDTDCRSDQACTGVSGGSGKACHPKGDADAGVSDAAPPDAA